MYRGNNYAETQERREMTKTEGGRIAQLTCGKLVLLSK